MNPQVHLMLIMHDKKTPTSQVSNPTINNEKYKYSAYGGGGGGGGV